MIFQIAKVVLKQIHIMSDIVFYLYDGRFRIQSRYPRKIIQ